MTSKPASRDRVLRFSFSVSRNGLTLVELMVVVVIIGILAGLLTVAVNSARKAVNAGVTKSELNGIAMAIESYKQKYGEYPPDFSDQSSIVRHVQKRWPRYTPRSTGNSAFERIANDIKLSSRAFLHDNAGASEWNFNLPTSLGLGTNDETADKRTGVLARDKARMSALAFWLGGMPAVPGNLEVPGGFHADSSDPFFLDVIYPNGVTNSPLAGNALFNALNNAPREQLLMEFSNTNYRHEQLGSAANEVDNGSHVPVGMTLLVRGQPVIYFRGTEVTREAARQEAYLSGGTSKRCRFRFMANTGIIDCGYAYPYALRTILGDSTGSALLSTPGNSPTTERCNITWANPSTFQLITPGRDQRFNGNDSDSATTPGIHPDPFVVAFGGGGTTAINATWDNITPLDLDNVVNFGDSATVEGQLP